MNATPPQKSSPGRAAWEVVQAILLALVLALLIRHYVVESFVVEGPSMEPTLYPGERLLVAKFVYYFRPPKRGDVIVFKPPKNTDKDYVKRIIAVGGDTVQLKQGYVYVNGERLDEPYVRFRSNTTTPPIQVPEGTVWVLGDNRPDSEDSRDFGEVPVSSIRGEAILIWWPLSAAAVLP